MSIVAFCISQYNRLVLYENVRTAVFICVPSLQAEKQVYLVVGG